MIITDTSTINLKDYDRFIAIGCSFTNYRWDTWADILSAEMPDAEYINLGTSGAGNQYIFTQLSHAITALDLTERDFVAIMWSGFYREDRYITGRHNNWVTPGNIFTQDEYSKEFINNFVDVRGYTVRDLALIDTATRVMESADFHAIQMMSIPYQLQAYHSGVEGTANDLDMEDLYTAYSRLETLMLPDLTYYMNPVKWDPVYSYTDPDGNEFQDYHPSALKYAGYLEYLGFKLTEQTHALVEAEHQRMTQVTTHLEIDQRDPTRILF